MLIAQGMEAMIQQILANRHAFNQDFRIILLLNNRRTNFVKILKAIQDTKKSLKRQEEL